MMNSQTNSATPNVSIEEEDDYATFVRTLPTEHLSDEMEALREDYTALLAEIGHRTAHEFQSLVELSVLLVTLNMTAVERAVSIAYKMGKVKPDSGVSKLHDVAGNHFQRN